jgi:hypothetical protein
MGKRRQSRDEKSTHQIRVNADLGEMIAWVARVEDTTTAQLLDPMLRAQVLARYAKHAAVIEKLKTAERALREVEEEARQVTREESGGEGTAKRPRRG